MVSPVDRRPPSSVGNLLSTYARPDIGGRLLSVRKRMGAKIVSRAFERAAQLGRLVPAAHPERHGLELIANQRYLNDDVREHALDVYRPTGAAPPGGWPVVFYVHGGAFRSLSKDTHWIMGLAFARRGFVVALPNYRLAPKHRFPAHLEDTAAALKYVVEHAREWGGDPTRIIFAGESAGANLITSLACCIAYERDEPYARMVRDLNVEPLAVLAACGIFEVTQARSRYQERFGKMNWFFEDRYSEIEEGYAALDDDGAVVPHDLVNPLSLLEREAPKRKLPPFFLPVGYFDHLKDDHARMERVLKRLGVDVEAPVYPGEIHAFHAFIFRKNARKCWQDHFDFLHKRGVSVANLHLDHVTRV